MKIKSRTELKAIILYGFVMFLHIIVYKTRGLTPHPSGFACHLPLGGEGLESAGVAAFAAELLGGVTVVEAFEDIFCSLGVENFGKGPVVHVAEGYYALAVEAAGNDTSVDENSEVVAQTVAKDARVALLGILVGPGEAVAVFKVQFISYSRAPTAPRPFVGEAFFQKIESYIVFTLVVTSVPEAEDGENAVF